MGYSYTRDDPDDMVTVVALGVLDERAPSPVRVVVEEVGTDAWTHTPREGGFVTVEEALQWCDDRLSRHGRTPSAGAADCVANPPGSPAKGACSSPARPIALTNKPTGATEHSRRSPVGQTGDSPDF